MAKDEHPNKEVREALEYAKANRWRVERSKGSVWGRMFCPKKDEVCWCGINCITSIWCTPQNPGNHARKLKAIVDKCIHAGDKRPKE